MSRTYTLRRRAQKQAETRRRIVDAAIELHASLGPARTSLSMVAKLASVQRNTLYAHFPDERSLMMACSAQMLENDPLPDAADWANLPQGPERLHAGLGALYGWYERNAHLAASVLSDSEHHALTREIVQLRLASPLAACLDVLGAGLNARQRALLRVAASFFTWRSLVREGAGDNAAAVSIMSAAVTCLTDS